MREYLVKLVIEDVERHRYCAMGYGVNSERFRDWIRGYKRKLF